MRRKTVNLYSHPNKNKVATQNFPSTPNSIRTTLLIMKIAASAAFATDYVVVNVDFVSVEILVKTK